MTPGCGAFAPFRAVFASAGLRDSVSVTGSGLGSQGFDIFRKLPSRADEIEQVRLTGP